MIAAVPLKLFSFHQDEESVLRSSIVAEVIEVEEVNGLYLVKAVGCTPEDVKAAKEWLHKAGYKKLAKRAAFVCL